MKVALVAVGSELLGGERRDTNGDWILKRVERAGGRVLLRVVVADDAEVLAETVSAAAATHDAVILSGGLGPTVDDRTREALAAALGRPLRRDPEMEERLAGAFAARGYPFGPAQARQAEKPEGAAWIPNPVGSAPGIAARLGACAVVALPGVPAELRAMLDGALAFLALTGTTCVARRSLKVAGRTESWVDERLADLYAGPGRRVTILASSGIVELQLRVEGSDPAAVEAGLDSLDRAMAERLGDNLFGRDGDTLPAVVGRLLRERGRTVATAESCTGGGVGAALTSVPGSSEWYRGGVVAYADDVKTALAHVPEGALRTHGAVSAAVAESLADGARRALGADHGLGVTGIAGPGGATADKPVGLVFVASSGPEGARVRELRLPGDRDLVRARTVVAALDLLRRDLLARGG